MHETHALANIRWWNMFLLFSAGLSKLFNGDHHAWYAWLDGESMRFYFENSRIPVPEPFYSLTMRYDAFAAAQCTIRRREATACRRARPDHGKPATRFHSRRANKTLVCSLTEAAILLLAVLDSTSGCNHGAARSSGAAAAHRRAAARLVSRNLR